MRVACVTCAVPAALLPRGQGPWVLGSPTLPGGAPSRLSLPVPTASPVRPCLLTQHLAGKWLKVEKVWLHVTTKPWPDTPRWTPWTSRTSARLTPHAVAGDPLSLPGVSQPHSRSAGLWLRRPDPWSGWLRPGALSTTVPLALCLRPQANPFTNRAQRPHGTALQPPGPFPGHLNPEGPDGPVTLPPCLSPGNFLASNHRFKVNFSSSELEVPPPTEVSQALGLRSFMPRSVPHLCGVGGDGSSSVLKTDPNSEKLNDVFKGIRLAMDRGTAGARLLPHAVLSHEATPA